MAGMLTKAIRGAATAGAEMSLENFKAEITRKRDERLQSFQRDQQENQQAFQASQQEKGWDRDDATRAEDRLAAEQSELRGISERAQGRILDQENQERQFGIAEENLAINREQLALTASQIEQALETGEFGLVEARRLQGLQEIIVDQDADPEEISAAVQTLRNLKGTDPVKYQFLKIEGDGFDVPDQIFRGNPGTGEGVIMDLRSPAGGSEFQSPEDVRAALNRGEIDRTQAVDLIRAMTQ